MKTFRLLAYIATLFTLMCACTKVENIQVEDIGGHNTKGDSPYYESLRAYKASASNYARPVAHGYFSNWSPTGVMRKGYLASIPDSMDIISMWSGAPNRFEITPAQKQDKEFVQKVKGVKLLEVLLLSHLGKGRTPASVYEPIDRQAKEEGWDERRLNEAKKLARWDFWGFTSHDLNNRDNLKEALAKYAKALCDSLVANDWDGFDIDWEPNYGFNDADGTLGNETMAFLVSEMGKYIGPNSDPEGKGHKLLCIDGEIDQLPASTDQYVDYWINQAYGRAVPHHLPPGGDIRKLIIAENFEAFARGGGRLLQQAAWMPTNGYKGGVSAYRFENDYDNAPDYKWMRQAIQINQQVFNDWKQAQGGRATQP